MKPKQIPHPDAKIGFTTLTPIELNAYRFSDKRTILTPELLESMAARQGSNTSDEQTVSTT